jgi:HD-GYP domain-containing protein (c-di-GMP phosphodiesterase class II)
MAELKDLIKRELESKSEKTQKKDITLKDEVSFRDLDMSKESTYKPPNSGQISQDQIFDRIALDPDEVYEESLQHMRAILSRIKDGLDFNIDPVFNISEKIVDSLQSSELTLNEFQNGQKNSSLLLNIYSIEQSLDDMAVHLVNVAVLSIEIGIGLKYEKENLIKLGVAGLFHDIGMCRISQEIIKKPGPLDSKEFDKVKRHPKYGFEILSSLGEEHAWLAKVVLQEHI